jgi:predicted HicB family RNase H-like nuclease
MRGKPKVHIVTVRLSPENYQKVTAAAKSSHQTLEEWIVEVCDMAMEGLIRL